MTHPKPIEFRGTSLNDLRDFPALARREAGAFRVIYIAKFSSAVYVLHCFQKKTRKISKVELDVINKRYRDLLKEILG